MLSPSLPTLGLVALLTTLASADFKVYAVTSVSADVVSGSTSTANGVAFYDGPPDCNDVCNSIFVSLQEDVSGGAGAARCDGCKGQDPTAWNINEFEYQHESKDGIHWTIYGNSGFQITPADGGPLRGSCVKDTSDDYVNCSCGLGNSENGQQILSCTSDYTAGSL